MDLHGPPPSSDREYLIRIYDAVQALALRVEALADAAKIQNGRVSRLESWRDRALGIVVGVSAAVSIVFGAAQLIVHWGK